MFRSTAHYGAFKYLCLYKKYQLVLGLDIFYLVTDIVMIRYCMCGVGFMLVNY